MLLDTDRDKIIDSIGEKAVYFLSDTYCCRTQNSRGKSRPPPAQIRHWVMFSSYSIMFCRVLSQKNCSILPCHHLNPPFGQRPRRGCPMASPHRGIFSVFVSVCPSVCPSPPAGSETLPAGSEVLPAGCKALPAGSEALPASSEALLACLEAFPTGFKALPVGSEALLTGSEIEQK